MKLKILDKELYSGDETLEGFAAAYEEAGAIDLRARKDLFLYSLLPASIDLGVAIQLDPGQMGILSDRSSTFLKRGWIMHQGFIDADYRGELSALVMWSGTSAGVREVKRGERVAQLAVVNIGQPKEWVLADELDETERGVKGFGSSGSN